MEVDPRLWSNVGDAYGNQWHARKQMFPTAAKVGKRTFPQDAWTVLLPAGEGGRVADG